MEGNWKKVLQEKLRWMFILCSVIYADEKRHRLFFPEGKGLLNEWALLAKALQGLGVKVNKDEKRKPFEIKLRRKEELPRGGLSEDLSFAAITKTGVRNQDTTWLDINNYIARRDLGMLKYGVVGSWE